MPYPSFSRIAGGLAPLLAVAAVALGSVPEARATGRYFGSDYVVFEAPVYVDAIFPGDFNGDARPDFLCWSSFQVSLLPGRRSGGFDPPLLLGGDVRLRDMELFDADGDGIADLVGPDRDSLELGYIPMRRSGGIGSFVPIFPGERSFYFDDGDFDGDGAIDLMVAVDDSPSVRFVSRDGQGAWHEIRSLDAGGASSSQLTGDLDGDGRSDAIRGVSAGRFFQSAYVVLRGGPGFAEAVPETLTFDPLPNITKEYSRFVDLDGDGLAELLSAWSGGLGIWRQSSPTHWVQRGVVPSQLYSSRLLAVVDIDLDGLSDLVIGDRSRGEIRYFHAAADGSFELTITRRGPPDMRCLAVGSWFSDGPEVAVASGNAHVMAIVPLDGDSQTSSQRIRIPNRRLGPIAIGDLDEDGVPDIVGSGFVTSETGVFWMTSGLRNGSFVIKEEDAGFAASALAIGDLDGDGHQDIVAASGDRGAVWCFPGNGHGRLERGREVYDDGLQGDIESRHLLIADLNRDGRPDLAFPGPDFRIVVLINEGGGRFGSPHSFDVQGFVVGMGASDQGGPAGTELYVLTDTPGRLVALRVDPWDGEIRAREQDSVSQSEGFTFADIDGDCRDDVIIRSGRSDRILIQRGLGEGRFATPSSLRMGHDLYWATALDLDGDGYKDLVSYDRDAGVLITRPKGLLGDESNLVESGIGAGLERPIFVDLDQDGRLDMVTVDRYDGDGLLILWNVEESPLASGPEGGPAPLRLILPAVTRSAVSLQIDGVETGEPVSLDVFDVTGRRVSSMPSREAESPRICRVWSGLDDNGGPMASGVYWFHVTAGQRSAVARVVMVR